MTTPDLTGYEFDRGSQPKLITEVSVASDRSSIYNQIDVERDYQDRQWGGEQHDDKKSPRDWASFIVTYLGKAMGKETSWATNLIAVRHRFIQIAALCVAAAESLDREFASRVEGAEPNDLEDNDPGITKGDK